MQIFASLVSIFLISLFPFQLAKKYNSHSGSGAFAPGVNPEKYASQEQEQEAIVGGSTYDPDAAPVTNVLDAATILQEKPHIQEHMEVPMDTEKMPEKELQFHYFRIADADNNNKLDGQELIYFIIHRHQETQTNATTHDGVGSNGGGGTHSHGEENSGSGSGSGSMRIFSDKELSDAIDPIMENNDVNGDGMIDWQEFIKSMDDQKKL